MSKILLELTLLSFDDKETIDECHWKRENASCEHNGGNIEQDTIYTIEISCEPYDEEC